LKYWSIGLCSNLSESGKLIGEVRLVRVNEGEAYLYQLEIYITMII
jgi:hypothetical protein